MEPSSQDALIVGAGPAGLSAALVLARALRSVTVVDGDDSGVKARSTWPQVNHNLLGWPDGVAAAELRARGRRQLAAYPVTLRDCAVRAVEGDDAGFATQLADGSVIHSNTLLIATGVQDHYPEFPGWETYVGRSLHWCLACDGYETRGTRVVVIGDSETAALDAVQLTRFAADVTLLTGSRAPVGEELEAALGRAGVRIVTEEVADAAGEDGQLSALITAKGLEIPCDHAFSLLPATPRSELAAGLGVRLSDGGYIEVDTEQHTSAAGVFAAGDVTRIHSHQIATALHEGTQAGHAINFALRA